jgi:dephospho-CoA kinase
MITIGITGGIGSGKTTVSNILTSMGYPVYFADIESKRLTNEDMRIKNGLIEKFGNEVFENDTLNKKFLAGKIFGNKENMRFVNSLIHPIVIEDFEEWKTKQNAPIVFIEAAILFETDFHKYVDKKLLIVSPLELRISRIEKRDNLNRDEIMNRIKNQKNDDEKMKHADFVIFNDEKNALLPQICSFLNKIYNADECSITNT